MSVKWSPPECESLFNNASKVIPDPGAMWAELAYSSISVGVSTSTDPAILKRLTENFPSAIDHVVKTCGHIDATVSTPASQYLPATESTATMTMEKIDASTEASTTFALTISTQMPDVLGQKMPVTRQTIVEGLKDNLMVSVIDASGADASALANVINAVLDAASDLSSATPSPFQSPTPAALATPSLPSRPAADLGLSRAIDTLPCNGEYATFYFSAKYPASYTSDITNALNAHPGSHYLVTEGSCTALTQESELGTKIYAVYSGPYLTLAEACSAAAATPGAYVKKLTATDNPDDARQGCAQN